MNITGRCYCGALAYEIRTDEVFRAQCHCRECQYFTGGHPQVALGVPGECFRYTTGKPQCYARSDLDRPVMREFCGTCGVHLAARSPALPDQILVRPGTLDDPSIFGQPQVAVYLGERQSFHQVPTEVPTFERVPE